MYSFLIKRGQTVAFLLGLVLVVIFLISIFSGLSGFESLSKDDKLTTTIFNAGLYSAIGLTILAAISAIVAGAIHLALDPKSSIKFLIGLGVVVIVFLIMYATSSGTPSSDLKELFMENDITDTLSKYISGGLKTVVALAGLCIAAIVAMEIWNIFK